MNEKQRATGTASDAAVADVTRGTLDLLPVQGVEHWTSKDGVRLFLWEKFVGTPQGKPVVLFVHIERGDIWWLMMMHACLVAFLGVIYWFSPTTRMLPRAQRVHPIWFMPMAVLMPVAAEISTGV